MTDLPAHVRHLGRGFTYEVLGKAALQIATNEKGLPSLIRTVSDQEAVVVYRSLLDGGIWARPMGEFMDGRFEPFEVEPVGNGDADDEHTAESSKAWMDSAMQFSRNADFYRGLVVDIGNLFGAAAYTSDDGSVHDSVLALKVPELVADLMTAGWSKLASPQRTGPAAIEKIEAYLRDIAGTPYGDDPDRMIAEAPMDPPDGGSQDKASITVGDLMDIVSAFRLHPAEVVRITRERLDKLEAAWNGPEHTPPGKGDISFLFRMARNFIGSPMCADPAPAIRELREICKELGCITKPGIALEFVKKQREEISRLHGRNTELIRSWDMASPTERQELDRMRRGWGPSSPTERLRRRDDVLSCLSILSSAMGEVCVGEDEDVPGDAQTFLDQAYARLDAHHTKMMAVVEKLNVEPAEWPDIKAAEERGAMSVMAMVQPDGIEAAKAIEQAAVDYERKAVATSLAQDAGFYSRRASLYREFAKVLRKASPSLPILWRFDMENCPQDRTPVLVTVPSMHEGVEPTAGEAYRVGPNDADWYWSGPGPGHALPMTETNCLPIAWAAMPAPAFISAKPPVFRPGDIIRDRSTGDHHLVALADPDTGDVFTFARHDGGLRPKADQFELLKAGDAYNRGLCLLQLKRSGGPVAERALALYGEPDAQTDKDPT